LYPVLVPSVFVSTLLLAPALALLNSLLLAPSTLKAIMLSATCYFLAYYAASFLAPVGAQRSIRHRVSAVKSALANWHKAVGVVLLASVYLLFAVPASIVMAVVPQRLRKELGPLLSKPE
jgi:hypothetical protein